MQSIPVSKAGIMATGSIAPTQLQQAQQPAPAMAAGAVGLVGIVVPNPVAAVRKRKHETVLTQARLMVVHSALVVPHSLKLVIRKVVICLVADTLKPNAAIYII